MIEYNMPREPAFKMSPKMKSIVSRIVALVLLPVWASPAFGLVVMVLLGFAFNRTVAAYYSRRLVEKPHEKKSRVFFMCAWRLGWEVSLWFIAILLVAFVSSGGGVIVERFGNMGGAGILILFVSSLPAVVRIGEILFQKSTNHSSSTEPSVICEAPDPNKPAAPAKAKGPKLNMWHRLWIVASAVYFVTLLPINVLMIREAPKGNKSVWYEYVSDRELDWAVELFESGGDLDWNQNGVVEITAPPEFPEYKIEAIKSDFEKARDTYIRNRKLEGAGFALLFWLGPVLLVYALGWGVAWIRAAAKD